jgi:hypothetical protein
MHVRVPGDRAGGRTERLLQTLKIAIPGGFWGTVHVCPLGGIRHAGWVRGPEVLAQQALQPGQFHAPTQRIEGGTRVRPT